MYPLQVTSGGFMVAFAGRKYAARSIPIFIGNSTYAVTSFTLVWFHLCVETWRISIPPTCGALSLSLSHLCRFLNSRRAYSRICTGSEMVVILVRTGSQLLFASIIKFVQSGRLAAKPRAVLSTAASVYNWPFRVLISTVPFSIHGTRCQIWSSTLSLDCTRTSGTLSLASITNSSKVSSDVNIWLLDSASIL